MSKRNITTVDIFFSIWITFAVCILLTYVLIVPSNMPEFKAEIREDGSGIIYRYNPDAGYIEYQDLDEGTFEWDCKTMGNEKCGSSDESEG